MKTASKILYLCMGLFFIDSNLAKSESTFWSDFVKSKISSSFAKVKSKPKSLSEILSDYCVPPVGQCDNKATFIQGKNICSCGDEFRFYNADKRYCQNCVLGSFSSEKNTKSCEILKCPDGYEPKLVSEGACPDGYSLRLVNADNGCGDGFTLKRYNTTAKQFEN